MLTIERNSELYNHIGEVISESLERLDEANDATTGKTLTDTEPTEEESEQVDAIISNLDLQELGLSHLSSIALEKAVLHALRSDAFNDDVQAILELPDTDTEAENEPEQEPDGESDTDTDTDDPEPEQLQADTDTDTDIEENNDTDTVATNTETEVIASQVQGEIDTDTENNVEAEEEESFEFDFARMVEHLERTGQTTNAQELYNSLENLLSDSNTENNLTETEAANFHYGHTHDDHTHSNRYFKSLFEKGKSLIFGKTKSGSFEERLTHVANRIIKSKTAKPEEKRSAKRALKRLEAGQAVTGISDKKDGHSRISEATKTSDNTTTDTAKTTSGSGSGQGSKKAKTVSSPKPVTGQNNSIADTSSKSDAGNNSESTTATSSATATAGFSVTALRENLDKLTAEDWKEIRNFLAENYPESYPGLKTEDTDTEAEPESDNEYAEDVDDNDNPDLDTDTDDDDTSEFSKLVAKKLIQAQSVKQKPDTATGTKQQDSTSTNSDTTTDTDKGVRMSQEVEARFKEQITKLQEELEQAKQSSRWAEQQLQRQEAQRKFDEAASFSAELVKSNKILPKVENALTAFYLQCIQDDADADADVLTASFNAESQAAGDTNKAELAAFTNDNGEPTRLALFKAIFDGMPEHNFTQEMVAVDPELAEIDRRRKEHIERLNKQANAQGQSVAGFSENGKSLAVLFSGMPNHKGMHGMNYAAGDDEGGMSENRKKQLKSMTSMGRSKKKKFPFTGDNAEPMKVK
jgi:hypothetical protein